MYLSKFQTVFVQIGKCICPNKNSTSSSKVFHRLFSAAHCTSQNYNLYLSKLKNVVVQIANRISELQIVFVKIENVFVQIANCICPNW